MTPARRPRARRGEGDRLREEILDAASDLLIATGSEDAVSIRAVADAVGVTPPSIYLHFTDKTDLVFAVCEEHFRRFDAEIEAAVAGSGDPVEELHVRARAYMRFGLEHPEEYRILFMTRPGHTAAGFGAEQVMNATAFVHLVDNVVRCRDAGLLRVDDEAAVSAMLWATVHGLTSLLIAKPDFPWPATPDVLLDQTLDVLDRGLLSDAARASR